VRGKRDRPVALASWRARTSRHSPPCLCPCGHGVAASRSARERQAGYGQDRRRPGARRVRRGRSRRGRPFLLPSWRASTSRCRPPCPCLHDGAASRSNLHPARPALAGQDQSRARRHPARPALAGQDQSRAWRHRLPRVARGRGQAPSGAQRIVQRRRRVQACSERGREVQREPRREYRAGLACHRGRNPVRRQRLV